MQVTPVPTDEEAVAIAAALTVVFSSGGGESAPLPSSDTSWRFSGRRWNTQRYGSRTTR